MSGRAWGLCVACLLAMGAGGAPGDAAAQPIAKANFLAEGSFALPASGPGALERPQAIAWAPDGRIHVADEQGTVAVFDASGSFVRSYGAGSVRKVAAVAVDLEGRAYVLDPEEKTVLLFDDAGEILHRIGSRGGRAGQLDDPVDMALGPAGLVYVLDKGRKGVQLFSRDGTFVHEVLLPTDATDPRALAVGPSGRIFVADKGIAGAMVQLPGLPGALGAVGLPSPDVDRLRFRGGSLGEPVAVVATPTGTVVAGDRDSGVLWSVDAADTAPVGSDDRVYGGRGSGRGSFRRLVDAALAGPDELLLLDRDARKVERVRLVLEADRPREAVEDYPVQFQSVSPELEGAVLATSPTGHGTVWYALGDAEGRNLRVVEAAMEERVGAFGNAIRLPRPLAGRPVHSFGQAVERAGDAALNDTLLVVTEPRRNRFHVFDLRTDGLIGSFGNEYSDDRRLRSPRGVALFPDGRIAVADHDNGRIAVFSADVATLLGTFPLPKAEGVTISAEGRMFGWDEDGISAGEFPLAGGAVVPLPPAMAAGGVGALETDRVGNLYALRRGSGQVAIADAGVERLLGRLGSEAGLEGGDRLTVDVDGNIYATDLDRGRSVALRWGMVVPAIDAVAVSWGSDYVELTWEGVAGSFIPGYQVDGAAAPEGPWTPMVAPVEARTRLTGGEFTWYRVAVRTLTGALGPPSPAVPALNLGAAAAFAAGDWDEARRLGRDALALIAAGDVGTDASVAPALGWQGFVSAHEAGDYADVLRWHDALGDGVPPERAFDHAFRLADAHQRLDNLEEAMDAALGALGIGSPAPAATDADRLGQLRDMAFENGWVLERWSDVVGVGEDIVRTSGDDADPGFVSRLALAHLRDGSPERTLELARSGLEAASSEGAGRPFRVLSFLAAVDMGDLALATTYEEEVGDSVPANLYVDFESTLTRFKVANQDLPGAQAELLAFLLGGPEDVRSLADPGVARTTLLVFGELIESGNPEGARLLLDSLAAALPPDLAETRMSLLRQADSVAAVAETQVRLGEGFGYYRDALFRDALRFFQEADGRSDLTVDQRLIVKEILAAVFHALGRVEDADTVFRGVYDLDPDFVLADHLAHVEATYGLSIFTAGMLDHFQGVGPIM